MTWREIMLWIQSFPPEYADVKALVVPPVSCPHMDAVPITAIGKTTAEPSIPVFLTGKPPR